jgi:hypothetical protein
VTASASQQAMPPSGAWEAPQLHGQRPGARPHATQLLVRPSADRTVSGAAIAWIGCPDSGRWYDPTTGQLLELS